MLDQVDLPPSPPPPLLLCLSLCFLFLPSDVSRKRMIRANFRDCPATRFQTIAANNRSAGVRARARAHASRQSRLPPLTSVIVAPASSARPGRDLIPGCQCVKVTGARDARDRDRDSAATLRDSPIDPRELPPAGSSFDPSPRPPAPPTRPPLPPRPMECR